jgi:ribosomal protein S26
MNFGRGMGSGSGRGTGSGGGRGRNRGGAYGPGGYCLCVKCGTKIEHDRGLKCTEIKCPNCGHTMVREELAKK